MDTAAAPNNRLDERSNMFVMATLYAAGGSTPVRIRNISRSGALIEAAALPPVGTDVRLTRASLSVAGEIVWVDQHRAGLRFATPTAASDWLPTGQRGTGQQLADELVHRARLGTVPTKTADPAPTAATDLQDELIRLHQLLHHAGEELASDEALAANHMMALQAIDGVAHSLAKLAGQMDRRAEPRSA
jgi:hypothetical protein